MNFRHLGKSKWEKNKQLSFSKIYKIDATLIQPTLKKRGEPKSTKSDVKREI